MKWSDYSYDGYYIPYDENQRAIRGFLLTTLNIDLNDIPSVFHESFRYFDRSKNQLSYYAKKVYLRDIVGSSYKDYADMRIIDSYMRIKRAPGYIQQGAVTRGKYFRALKKPCKDQLCPVMLSCDETQSYYWVDGNGNHRIVFYKIMMLAEIAEECKKYYGGTYDPSYMRFDHITEKYWLNAFIWN